MTNRFIKAKRVFKVEEEEEEQDVPETAIPENNQGITPPGTYARECGVLFLTSIFDMDSVRPLVSSIVEYNLMPPELRPERITMFINSPGGRIDACKMLVDTMWMSEIPVDTFAIGEACSCGIITLMAGHHRMATPSCEIMSHQYSGGSGGKEHEIYGRIKSFEMMTDWMESHYKTCTGLSKKKIRKELLGPTDVWLSPKEAMAYNIIDEIVPIKHPWDKKKKAK